ncbi:MAG: Na(+)-translocating NADH-quinone reductase subunit C [bacterium]|nr:Na(+)-translocating NADH-quinone reductase subunit C [bacterium]
MQHSTGYIIGFMTAVCLVCSVFVAGSAVSLKARQDANVVLDRQTKVLTVSGLVAQDESLSDDEIGELFDARVIARAVDLETGKYNEEVDANAYDQRKAMKDPALSKLADDNPAKVRRLPNVGLVYQVQAEDGGLDTIIIPIEGMGLWGTLYGYLALSPDTRTIKGITFYQHKETPGLGGEVDNPRWKSLWKGRLAFDEKWAAKISVIKGRAGSPTDDPYRVDGLSGATITSRGVDNLVRYWLGDSGFGPYLAGVRAGKS